MQELKNNIRVQSVLLPASLDEDNSPVASAAIDCREIDEAGGPMFDSGLISVSVGEKGADVTVIKLKVEEDDDVAFGSPTTPEGGAEVTVLEETLTNFQVVRSKRYLRLVVTLTATGAADTVPVAAVAVLSNWATPFPLV